MKTKRIPLVALLLSVLFFLLLAIPTAYAQPDQQSAPPTQGRLRATANLRAAPGTASTIVGRVEADTVVSIAGCNAACDWYQLESGEWVAAILIEPVTPANSAASLASAAKPKPAALPTVTPPAATITITGTVAANAGNLRAGPGTTYAVVGSVKAGQPLEVTGQTTAGDWLQLEDGNWIAAFLVRNAPVGLAVVEAPAAPDSVPPTTASAGAGAASPTNDMQSAMNLWQERKELNVVKTCGHFEYKVTDVRRIKSLWWGRSEYIAQGEWLLVFVEVRNISSGTSFFGKSSPRLAVVTPDGQIASGTGDFKASAYAGWMYQHGGFYEDINPGRVLGLVEAWDLSLEPDRMLGLGLLECENQLVSLGLWSQVPAPDPK